MAGHIECREGDTFDLELLHIKADRWDVHVAFDVKRFEANDDGGFATGVQADDQDFGLALFTDEQTDELVQKALMTRGHKRQSWIFVVSLASVYVQPLSSRLRTVVFFKMEETIIVKYNVDAFMRKATSQVVKKLDP